MNSVAGGMFVGDMGCFHAFHKRFVNQIVHHIFDFFFLRKIKKKSTPQLTCMSHKLLSMSPASLHAPPSMFPQIPRCPSASPMSHNFSPCLPDSLHVPPYLHVPHLTSIHQSKQKTEAGTLIDASNKTKSRYFSLKSLLKLPMLMAIASLRLGY